MREIVRLLVGLLVLSFVAGSTSAALACVAPAAVAASAQMLAGCPDMPVKAGKHDQTSACVPMCAALAPAVSPATVPSPIISCAITPRSHPVLAWNARPEPPPPRAG